MNRKQGLPIIPFPSQEQWEAWLDRNHATVSGVWIKFAKKDSGIGSLSHSEALDSALCYGWIDGQTASYDAKFWLQRFTPRGPQSKWSKINCTKAAKLFAEGKLKPPGLQEVESAKRDGRWSAAYDSQRTMTVPDDLQQELERNPRAREFFAGLDSKNRYAVLYRIHGAKKPETRARRIQTFVTMLNERKAIHPSTLLKAPRPGKPKPVAPGAHRRAKKRRR
jgi:uncharacterized protein YdeI (YjbR/CyaY-like superfamily)